MKRYVKKIHKMQMISEKTDFFSAKCEWDAVRLMLGTYPQNCG